MLPALILLHRGGTPFHSPGEFPPGICPTTFQRLAWVRTSQLGRGHSSRRARRQCGWGLAAEETLRAGGNPPAPSSTSSTSPGDLQLSHHELDDPQDSTPGNVAPSGASSAGGRDCRALTHAQATGAEWPSPSGSQGGGTFAGGFCRLLLPPFFGTRGTMVSVPPLRAGAAPLPAAAPPGAQLLASPS